MAWISVDQLRAGLEKLETPAVVNAASCPVLRLDSNGSTSRPLLVGTDVYADVEYGPHSRDYLVIDSVTLEVTCGACAGVLDATVVIP